MAATIQEHLVKAKKTVEGFPVRRLYDAGIFVDRVNENPEAARYFLMFAEWGPISPEEIFSNLDNHTARRTHLYIDFAFCKKFCEFCAFYGVVPRSMREVEEYAECLKREVTMLKKLYFDQGFSADSLEFGGGTPTFFPLPLLKDVTEHVRKEFPFLPGSEFNFEASPETLVGPEGMQKLEFLKRSGANRMSIGAQSFEEHVLKSTNRPHSLQDVHESIANAKSVGFERINIDLMVGLCGQTVEGFLSSVAHTIDYGVDIIELYTMRYFDTKDFVPMKQKLAQKEMFLGKDEILLARVAADSILKEAGYGSTNGRTYTRQGSPRLFYAAYYEGNFKGENTLGIGRKSNSNMYPWQYANYRDLHKYENAARSGILPIAAGARFSHKARAAKLMSGMFQLPGPMRYAALSQQFQDPWKGVFDRLMERFEELDLVVRVQDGFEKTPLGFFFIEELLKEIYNAAVTPYSVSSLFLGKEQAR